MARGEEVGLDDELHIPGARGPVADLLEVGRGVTTLGEVDAGEKGMEAGRIVFPVVFARAVDAVITEGAGGGEIAEVEVVTGVMGA